MFIISEQRIHTHTYKQCIDTLIYTNAYIHTYIRYTHTYTHIHFPTHFPPLILHPCIAYCTDLIGKSTELINLARRLGFNEIAEDLQRSGARFVQTALTLQKFPDELSEEQKSQVGFKKKTHIFV